MTKWKTALKDTFEISAQTLQDTQVPCSKGSGPLAPLLPTRHKHGSDYLFTGCSYGNHWPCRCRLQGCFILMHSRMIHCDVGAAANIASKLFAYFGNYQSKLRIIADYTKNFNSQPNNNCCYFYLKLLIKIVLLEIIVLNQKCYQS